MTESKRKVGGMETMVFDTALGEFGIGWTDAGVARVQLPGMDHAALLQRINRGGVWECVRTSGCRKWRTHQPNCGIPVDAVG